MRTALIALAACACTHAPPATRPTRDVTIARDDRGIAHVHGRTDADAVFGMVYAQAEDDFARIELNYLEAMGRRAEREGDAAIWRDVRRKLFFDERETRALYAKCEPWLRELMDAWADGLNAYLAKHPVARVLKHFEPWMALAFSEGSISDDVESNVQLDALASFYGHKAEEPAKPDGGSNGIAIAPQNTLGKHALLLINPHTTHYFRSELQMTSDEGLNVYGAVTWGQFFVYQGFNERLGFMHTTSTADTVDEYAETIPRAGFSDERPFERRTVTVAYKTAQGLASRTFDTWRTHRGPIVRAENGRWISIRLMQRPVEALTESFLRTKARNLAEFQQTLAQHANSSNDTVYADADGHIAYFHPSFVPKRDDRFDWTRPVDGTDPATEWQGIHDDAPRVVDPPSGWLHNTNNGPWSAAGPGTLQPGAFPRYMDAIGENPRSVHAQALLDGHTGFTLAKLVEAAFDSRLPAFDLLIPLLPQNGEPAAMLKAWDRRWAASSVETTLAVAFGEEVWRMHPKGPRGSMRALESAKAELKPEDFAKALDVATKRLVESFGTWKIPWGEVNRFQRISDDVVQKFDDAQPSIPVPFTSGQWGSLAAFEAPQWALRPAYTTPPDPRAKKRYGVSGNSFVAAIEFTPEGPHAVSVTAGGESGDPASPHFRDQMADYASGHLREVYFTSAQLAAHLERTYKP